MIPPADPAKRGTYFGLLALTGVFTAAAILTLVPNPSAPWPNLWNYKSICPFAPGATLACGFLAGVCCTLRNRLVRAEKSAPVVPVVVLAVLLALTTWSTFVWAGIKAQYPDVRTSASVSSP